MSDTGPKKITNELTPRVAHATYQGCHIVVHRLVEWAIIPLPHELPFLTLGLAGLALALERK